MMLYMKFFHQSVPLAKVFRISRGSKTTAEVIVVTVTDGTYRGWGESVPYARYGESISTVSYQLENLQTLLNASTGSPLTEALGFLPPGAAKNALDCAIWDLKCKQHSKNIFELTNLPSLQNCITAQTLSVDTAEVMQREAAKLYSAPLVKVKLDAQDVISKMSAIQNVCPNSKFIIDANEGWSIDLLEKVVEPLAKLNVCLIEQPLPSSDDDALIGFNTPIPLCADESCHTSTDIERLCDRYQAINIKLDKTGGLTEAIELLTSAKSAKLKTMIGCMVGTSLGMAPAFALCHGVDYVDLDGPILIAQDRLNGFEYKDGRISLPENLLWGSTNQRFSIEQISAIEERST